MVGIGFVDDGKNCSDNSGLNLPQKTEPSELWRFPNRPFSSAGSLGDHGQQIKSLLLGPMTKKSSSLQE